jgi:Ca2+-binding EF-hand superfamily protein
MVVGIGIKLPGDVNGDGKVTLRDVRLVRRHLGETPSSATWDGRADVNCDGKVSARDLRKVRRQIGKRGGCGCQ